MEKYLYSPIDGRTIVAGREPASFTSTCSAKAFVNVYVLGLLPINLKYVITINLYNWTPILKNMNMVQNKVNTT